MHAKTCSVQSKTLVRTCTHGHAFNQLIYSLLYVQSSQSIAKLWQKCIVCQQDVLKSESGKNDETMRTSLPSAGEAAAAFAKVLLSEDLDYERRLIAAAAGSASRDKSWIDKRRKVVAPDRARQLSQLVTWTNMYLSAVDVNTGEYLFTTETIRRITCLLTRVARGMYEGMSLKLLLLDL